VLTRLPPVSSLRFSVLFDSREGEMATPFDHVHLASIQSTQDEARRRYQSGPVLVTAGRQTAGRGRTGREWWQAPRAVFASLAFVPDWPVSEWSRLTLVAGLAALEALPPTAALKWPNDVVDGGGAKLAGLLAEATGSIVVIGLGVNLWWPDPPAGTAAAFGDDPGDERAGDIARAWAGNLLARIDRGAVAWGRDEYLEACVLVGEQIRWEPDGSGRVVDVDPAGALIVVAGAVRHRLVAGEVSRVRAIERTTLTGEDRPTGEEAQ